MRDEKNTREKRTSKERGRGVQRDEGLSEGRKGLKEGKVSRKHLVRRSAGR